jgi:hypothetical protein
MTGSLKVTLSGPAGFTSIVTTVPLTGTGNGTYTVTDTLQPSSTPVGTYTWTVTYAGNTNNNPANDQGGSAEQFTIQNVVSKNEAAIKGFGANMNGQALIKSAQWAASATPLGNWLATSWPKLFGNLAGATNTQIASYYVLLKGASGLNNTTTLDAMATALAIYASTTGLGWGTTSRSYGFMQGFGGAGLGSILDNVGSNGASFGVANNTYLTVTQILNYYNSVATVITSRSKTTLGTWTFYGSPSNITLLNGANIVIDGINQTDDIV